MDEWTCLFSHRVSLLAPPFVVSFSIPAPRVFVENFPLFYNFCGGIWGLADDLRESAAWGGRPKSMSPQQSRRRNPGATHRKSLKVADKPVQCAIVAVFVAANHVLANERCDLDCAFQSCRFAKITELYRYQ